jgi:putative membrane protein
MTMDIVLKFLLSVFIISGLFLILPGIKVQKTYCAVITSIPITIMNMLISPLFNYFEVPITALGFGVIIVILDALLLWFFGKILKKISVDGFGWAFVFAVILSLIVYLVEMVFDPGYFNINFT